MEMVNIKINGMPLSACRKGTTILEAARMPAFEIPTLCYLKEINEIGACRICVVEVKGARTLVTACVYPVDRGHGDHSPIPRSVSAEPARRPLSLFFPTHDKKCLSCVRSGNCELQKLCHELRRGRRGSLRRRNDPDHEIDDLRRAS